jgi:hypothetical protein
LLEEAVDPLALRLVAFGVVQDHDACGQQRRHQRVIEQGVLFLGQLLGGRRQVGQFAARRLRTGLARRFHQVGHAHLEELVEVGRHDGQVAQPLQQRHIVTTGLGQHAPVELQDRALAIQQGRHSGERR